LRSLKDSAYAAVDLGFVLMVGIVFAALMVIAYLIWEVYDDLVATTVGQNDARLELNTSLHNVTTGFDNAINLLLVAVTIMILAIAISALLMLRSR